MDLKLEEISRQMLLIVRRDIDDALAEVDAEMAPNDAAFYAEMGIVPAPVTTLDPPVEWFVGHNPTAIERPVASYPFVSVMTWHSASDQQQPRGDQTEALQYETFVEAFVISQDEAEVNRLAWRYAKALHLVIGRHKSLDSFVNEIKKAPNVDISNAIQRRESATDNTLWFIQGVRFDLQFTIDEEWDFKWWQ